MSTTVFPVGHYGGTRPSETHVVRVGWKQHQLSEDAFAAWVMAHGLPDGGKGPWTVDDVIGQCGQVGILDPAKELEGLADAGLVAVLDDPKGFARSHRMDVLFVGLGNAPDRVDGHAVGIPGLGTAAVLDPDCYELWQWGSVAPTLWHSCDVRATVTAAHEQVADPVRALAEILGDLRFLIAHGCAYLDVAG